MFSGIKDKLLSVKKNVSLFVTDDTSSKSNAKARFDPRTGAEILQHFQNHWEEIHKLNEENAKSADNVATAIETVSKNVEASKTNIDLISHILTSSNFTTNVAQCLSQVKELYATCESVEQKLVDLENLIEDVQFERTVKQHRQNLENYKIRKQEKLDKLKQSLEEEYKKKLSEHESNKKLILEERQKVFQEAFKSDLEVYKNLGTIPKVDLPKNQNGAILEEIQLDFDQNELEQFFNEENNDT
ncbi:unnamed protein product [Ceutorhynchus assimilis]|uniref:Dysbindin n=1 Tax=Ceutorhynchus assimilis TaxID=467358 RepID=A0A9N9MH61_9CUCU|nr:unnamed protein product [Ceutorhynchus assimilis]